MYTIIHVFSRYLDGRIWITQFPQYISNKRPDLKLRVGLATLSISVGNIRHVGMLYSKGDFSHRIAGLEPIRAFVHDCGIYSEDLENLQFRLMRGKIRATSDGFDKPKIGVVTASSGLSQDFRQMLSYN